MLLAAENNMYTVGGSEIFIVVFVAIVLYIGEIQEKHHEQKILKHV
jgi:hypothetical protein